MSTRSKIVKSAVVAIGVPLLAIGLRTIRSFFGKQLQTPKNKLNKSLDEESSYEDAGAEIQDLSFSKADISKETYSSVSEKLDPLLRPPSLLGQRSIAKEEVHSSEIEGFISARGILNLIHFTQVEKLPFILEEGILSNERIKQLQRPVLDANRHDKRPGYVCVSISFPNYQMFYSYHKGEPANWCVILINPKVLMKNGCLFFPYNAASNELSRRPNSAYNGVTALQNMYADKIQSVSRNQDLRNPFPTSPQAEVLVPNLVSVEDIKGIHFSSSSAFSCCQKLLSESNIPGTVSNKYFLPRIDWKDWS